MSERMLVSFVLGALVAATLVLTWPFQAFVLKRRIDDIQRRVELLEKR